MFDRQCAFGHQGSDGKGHGDAVIQKTVQYSAVQRSSAADNHPVICSCDICTHGTQMMDHDVEPVRFLDFQLFSVADRCCSLSKSGQDGNDRDFIDQCRYDIAFDRTAFQIRCVADENICDSFSAGSMFIQTSHF